MMCCIGPIGGKRRGNQSRVGESAAFESEETYGDEERKCIKEFKEAYNSFTKVAPGQKCATPSIVQFLGFTSLFLLL